MKIHNIKFKAASSFAILGVILLFGIKGETNAQDLNKEVYVVSSFKPEVADADMISIMPEQLDTFSFSTKIDYTVLPSRIDSKFSPRPIKAAKMVGTPLDKLYNSYVKAGFGNYTTPYIEYSIQNLRSKEYAIGAYVSHKSSHKRRDIANVKNVPSGYGKNDLLLYGKKFYKDFNLLAEVGAKNHKIRHYGISGMVPDTTEVKREAIRQTYNKVFAKIGMHSVYADSAKIDYKLFLQADYFWDRFKNKEPHIKVNAEIGVPIKGFRIATGIDYDQFSYKGEVERVSRSLLTIHPKLSKKKEEWKLELGSRISLYKTNDVSKTYISFDGLFKFNVIDDGLAGFFGVDGYVDPNSYQQVSQYNPYIIPGIYAEPTWHRLIIFTGIEGRLSPKSSYRLNVNFENMDNMLFFVNSDTNEFQNQYDLSPMDADRIKYHAEFNWRPLSYLEFFLMTNYYSYKMPGTEEPWQIPTFDLNFTSRYNFKEKVFVELDIINIGKRVAKNINGGENIDLDAIWDLNLKIDYKYSNILGVFLHLHNLTNQHYMLWNQYPVQGLNVLAGVSYKF